MMNGQESPDSGGGPHESVLSNGCSQQQTLDDWVIKALDNLTDDTDDLPSALISTNLDSRIFSDPLFKVSICTAVTSVTCKSAAI